LIGSAEKEGSIIGHLTTQITPIIVPHYLLLVPTLPRSSLYTSPAVPR